MNNIRKAAGRVFNGDYLALAAILSFLFFALYIAIPVITIPGNDVAFHLSATPQLELILNAILSVVMGILFSMQIYSWRNRMGDFTNAGFSFAGLFSGGISTLFASASCAGCVGALFSFIGFSGITFLLEHKMEIMLGTFAIALIALHFTSNKINGNCRSCTLEPDKAVENAKEDKTRKGS